MTIHVSLLNKRTEIVEGFGLLPGPYLLMIRVLDWVSMRLCQWTMWHESLPSQTSILATGAKNWFGASDKDYSRQVMNHNIGVFHHDSSSPFPLNDFV